MTLETCGEKETNGDRVDVLPVLLCRDVFSLCSGPLGWLSGAERSHILDATYRRLLIFLPLPSTSPILFLNVRLQYVAAVLPLHICHFMSFTTPLLIVMAVSRIMF